MGLGLGIFLLVAGAILAFAVKANINDVDLTTVGYILIGAGVLVMIISVAIMVPRRRRAQSTTITTDNAGRQYMTERDDRYNGL